MKTFEDSYPQSLQAVDDKVFIVTYYESERRSETWVSDGTPQGTQLYADREREMGWFVKFRDRLFFTASDPLHGWELWVADGAAGSTVLFKDLLPGTEGSNPGELTVVGERLYFSAQDSQHGRELWNSDGTPEGTSLLDDIVPGIGDSNPGDLTAVGNQLFFTTYVPRRGFELWVLPIDVPAQRFLRADTNADAVVDLSDAVFTLGALFLGRGELPCAEAADVNDDGGVDISDPVALLAYLFLGTPAPPAPFASCGVDPTPDALECQEHAPCAG